MKARLFSLWVTLMCVFVTLQAQSFEKLWKDVKAMEKLDRPKSALELTRTIYRKAQHERNVPEMMKAYMLGMDFRESITPDSVVNDIEGLERWVKDTREPLDAAVLHSVLAELYANYFSGQSLVSLRSKATTDISEDMTGWSGNIFIQKIFEHIRLSLKDRELLAKTNTDAFKPIMERGETSGYFRHDMFHLLGQRAVAVLSPLKWRANGYYPQTMTYPDSGYLSTTEFLKEEVPQASVYDCLAEVMRIYRSMLQYYVTADNLPAAALVDLSRLEVLDNNSDEALDTRTDGVEALIRSPFYRALTGLSNRYASVDVCAEVYKDMADFALRNNFPAEALRLSKEALRKYPSYSRINMFRELESNILSPRLSGESDQTAYPGKEFKLRITYCNLSELTVKMYRVNLPVTSGLLRSPDDKSFLSKYAKLEKSERFKVVPTTDYIPADTVLKVTAPGEGIWLLEVVPDVKVKHNDFDLLYVSRLKVINRVLPSSEIQFVVVDSESGYPVPQAQVLLYNRSDKGMEQTGELNTDEGGTASWEKEGKFDAYRAQKGTDNAMDFINSWYLRYPSNNGVSQDKSLSLFTDRSIYRPGQTVYVAGIAYEVDGDSTGVLANKDYTIGLYDTNQKMIVEKQVRTNEFGSFAGEFQLPSQSLAGRFSLKAGTVRTWFQVDEYKRPTFDVVFIPVKATYSVGDSIRVTGVAKTYSGVPVQNGEVKYSIKTAFPYWMSQNNGTSIGSGVTRTNAKGEFSVPVYLKPQTTTVRPFYLYYNYVVNAAITDGAGETQSGTLNIPSGQNPLVITCTIPERIQKESRDSLTVYVRNLNGEPLAVNGRMEIYELTAAPDGNSNIVGKRVLEETFVANRSFKPISILNLPSGMYRLVFSVKDSQGRDIKQESDFILFSMNDSKPPYQTPCWFQVVKKEFSENSPATLLFGTSEKDVYVLCDVFSGGKQLESRRILLTDSVMKMVYPYKAGYGDGLFVQFAFVKNGKFYEVNTTIIKEAPNKKLTLKWETFRDKLRPGQTEEWKLRILSPDGKPADSELLATMYDASLDKLAAHDWNFYLYFPRPVLRTQWNSAYPGTVFLNTIFFIKEWKYKELDYDKLTVGSLNERRQNNIFYSKSDKRFFTGAVPSRAQASAGNMDMTSEVAVKLADSTVEEVSMEASSSAEVQIRENFAETAFFYPQLRTNAQGEVNISFTLPESLTQWKFMGLSHTRKMDWGQIEAMATASKDFMISPNMPRFVRVGDAASIAASIINLTGKEIAGVAKMELFNPETEKVLVTQKQNFKVKAGETGAVSFAFTVGENYPQLLACRMIAEGGHFSDGEQRLLPVLSNKQQITESVSITVDGKETREYSLAGLFNHNSETATDRRLTVEFTGNPAWYAVQALPSLSNPATDNAISLASAFYANSVASYIMNANPRIKTIFDSWKQQGGTKETLLSNLEKNQELKNILLQETPWVMEATNEADQKQRLGTLFDLNTLQYSNSILISKLKGLQQNGAWSWYKGMGPSPYVTLFVAEALGRLPVLTGNPLPRDAQQFQNGTWEYLHREALSTYKSMIKAGKEGAKDQLLPEPTLRYLYLCALTGQPVPPANKEAQTYFINRVAGTLTQQNLSEKAMSAVILEQAGRTTDANNFIVSLKEYAVEMPGMGMYYDAPGAPYSTNSYRIPTQVTIIEAMQLVGKDMKTVEQMKIWLLKQKQTQSWDSPVATVNAVYALLNRGTDLLTDDGKVKITLGKQVIETNSPGEASGAGFDYVKKTFTGNGIKPDMKSVTVQKQGEGIAWGAVYAQYLEEISKVAKQGGALSVDKKLYVENVTDNRPLLTPLKEIKALSVGDKVVSRITIKTDRDMDFIQLKDERAACLEPVSQLSGYQWINNTGCYIAIKDASTEFFFDGLRKGTYVLEYSYYVTREGSYSGGIATLQSAYAPEFSAHTASEQVKVIK